MRNKLLYLLLLLMPLLLFAACQRVIDVQIANTQPQLVIEANLTNQSGTQVVKLSNTINYSSTNVFPPVSGAIVTISGNNGYPPFKFTETQPGTYTANARGISTGIYTCNVQVNNQNYQATSAMPIMVNMDSLGVFGQVFGSKTIKTIEVFYQDPPGVPNQYRFVMRVNGVQVNRIFVNTDRLSDGRKITMMLYQQDIELKTGDKVDVEMQCIDSNVFNYWYNLSSQNGNTPADSATPSNPTSNFNNNVLGYFSAHTTQHKTIIVP